MSIADLKMRLADVQGIETLSMALEAGRILLRWGAGYSATVDAAASDGEIETAIRSAIRLPAASLVTEKPARPPAQQDIRPNVKNLREGIPGGFGGLT